MRTMVGPARAAAAVGLAVGLAVTGCSGGKPSAQECQTVSAQLADIPTRTDQEPRMRIPVPAGWERSAQMDSEQIRFALRAAALAADGFAPNAVVTLQRVGADLGKPEQILRAQIDQLVKKLKLTDVVSTPTTVCGAPALSSAYTTPQIKLGPKIPPLPPRKATLLGVVYRDRDANYVATLTVQAVNADNPTFAGDSAELLGGFQVLPPR